MKRIESKILYPFFVRTDLIEQNGLQKRKYSDKEKIYGRRQKQQ